MRAIVIVETEYEEVTGSEVYLISDDEQSAEVVLQAMQRFIDITELSEEEAMEYAGGGSWSDMEGRTVHIFWADYVE